MQVSDPGVDQPNSLPEHGVACVWLPYFLIRAEVLRHPTWEGRPLVLASGAGQRKVVQLCSPEAERLGMYCGLPIRDVLSFSPDAIVCQPDPLHTSTVLDKVLSKLQRVSPAVEPADERFFLDLRGLGGVYQHRLDLLERAIRAAVPPVLQPRIGIAAGKFVASIAACVAPPSGMRTVSDRETGQFLAPLSVSYLQLPPDALKRLERLGLYTLADLAALPFSAVQAEFGPAGAQAWRLANGQDRALVVPRPVTSTVHASLRFDHALASIDAILAALSSLLAHAFGDPALRGHSVRQAQLHGLLADGTSWRRLVTFKEALSSKSAAYDALKSKLLLPQALPTAPFEEFSLELLGLSGEGAKQPSLFSARARRQTEIVEATRQLHARYGDTPLYRATEVEPWSRVPERRWALIPYEP